MRRFSTLGIEIGSASGRKSDDDTHRPRWISLRPSEARCEWQRGCARGQMQEIAAGKFHGFSSTNIDKIARAYLMSAVTLSTIGFGVA